MILPLFETLGQLDERTARELNVETVVLKRGVYRLAFGAADLR